MGVVFGLIIGMAMISLCFEIVALGMFLNPRVRGQLLGNQDAKRIVHAVVLASNLYVHWGTIAGTTSAMLAFCMSPIAMALAKYLYGYFTEDEIFKHGLFKYSAKELLTEEQYLAYITTLANKAQHELTKFEQHELNQYAST